MRFKLIFIVIIVFFTIVSCEKDQDNIRAFHEAIYICDSNGENDKKVTDIRTGKSVLFIPNTDRLLFEERGSLYTIKSDGSDKKLISGDMDVCCNQSVSYDGKYVAFISDQKNRDLIVYDLVSDQIVFDQKSRSSVFICKFSNKNQNLYYTTVNDAQWKIIFLELETGKITELYKTSLIVGDIFLDSDDENMFFLESVDGFNSYLKEIDLNNLETQLLNTDPILRGNRRSDTNGEYFLLKSVSRIWNIYDSLFASVAELADCGCPILSSDNKAMYETDLSIDDSQLKLYDINNDTTIIISETARHSAFSNDGKKIAYIGGYYTKKENKKLIFN